MSELPDAWAALPKAWRAELERKSVRPVHSGMSGSLVFRIGDEASAPEYLKLAQGLGASALSDEIKRTGWLARQGIRVPDIVKTLEADGFAAALMSAVPGRPLDCGSDDPLRDIGFLAAALARLHALPTGGCPFNETVRVRLARAREDIDRGAIDPSHFDARNAGVAPGALWDRLASDIPDEDIVVVHGDASLANILIDTDGAIGFVDCGRAGRADRYTDLTLIVAELGGDAGEDAAHAFLRLYGSAAWDAGKALYFLDLYELF